MRLWFKLVLSPLHRPPPSGRSCRRSRLGKISQNPCQVDFHPKICAVADSPGSCLLRRTPILHELPYRALTRAFAVDGPVTPYISVHKNFKNTALILQYMMSFHCRDQTTVFWFFLYYNFVRQKIQHSQHRTLKQFSNSFYAK